MYDVLVVGAGLYGATCAQLLTDAGKRVLVLEKRDHVGGNCADTVIDGVRVSRHGGHIFHTNSTRIWQFVNNFADWLPYTHRVLANAGGRLYSFPPNLTTYEQLGIDMDSDRLAPALKDMFFAGYTAKQWRKSIDDLPPGILDRIPIRETSDDRYFTDIYQGLPADGYSAMIIRMLDGIDVLCGVDYLDNGLNFENLGREVIYTGPIDAFYGYDLGRLAYRSLRFETRMVKQSPYQPAATVNYCDADVPYTRIMDWGQFWPKQVQHTVITTEYPADDGEPYYPVNDAENNALHSAYMYRSKKALSYIHIGGRLGNYRYWNMDQAIGAAMALVERLV